MPARVASAGQVLVLFVLFLLVLLGVSAVGIDYATWLLTDRNLQNTADHAALAGASQFQDRTTATTCTGTKCYDARRQAWTSLNDELNLGLLSGQIDTLAIDNTLAAGVTGITPAMNDRFWVSTPPPTYAAYPGLYDLNQGVVFVRVDRAVTSFLGGALGIQPQVRTGWATAGALPTDFALQIFCRNHISPQSGVCENSAGLTIDGQGGVTLLKGDVGSNESLTVTANVGSGLIVQDGNVFLVNRTCHNSTWRCPNGPPSRGGISDGSGNGKNAFHIAPLPVPRYESPDDIEFASNSACPTTTEWNDPLTGGRPCIPYQSQYLAVPATGPGDWACNDGTTACGIPNLASTPPSCGAGAFNPSTRFLRPNADDSNQGGRWDGFSLTSDIYRNIDDDPGPDPAGGLPGSNPGSAVLAGSPTDWVASEDNRAVLYRVALSPPQGTPGGADMTVRYVTFRTANQVLSAAGGATVPLEVRLVQKVGSAYELRGTEQTHSLDHNVTVYQYQVPLSSMTGSTWYNSLYLEFEVPTAVAARGAGVSWAEAEIASLSQPLPPTIKPGYWKSITIPAGGCAVMDPAPSSGLLQYQLPGVYRFGGTGNGASAPRIVLGNGAMLIGDGVTMLFDPRSGNTGFPDNGIDIDRNGAMVINTGTTTSNPSAPLSALPADAINAAWRVDNADTTNPRNGEISWPVCLTGGNDCVPRSCYMNTNVSACGGQTVATLQFGRGTSFYLTPDWSSPDIQRRFYMGGNGNADAPGVLFKAVLYAPYDDVKITGRNNFNTVGQVMAWTAKFNGGSASLFLDYPYDYTPASPYLLEPTVDH